MRSMLFVPGDSVRKFESARKTAADCLILDLEDSVAPDQKVSARSIVVSMLKQNDGHQKLYVRVNALDTGLTLGDLAAVVPARPDGIVLPEMRRRRRHRQAVALSRRFRSRRRDRTRPYPHRAGRHRNGARGVQARVVCGMQQALVG